MIHARIKLIIVFGACLLTFTLLVRAAGQAPESGQLTPQQKRGKEIYLRGTSPSGKEVMAFLGGSGVEVPATAMPCANCHGLAGQGKPEGGVTPSNITWEALTKSYGVTHPDGRKHPPYTDRAMELAITRGHDPGGNKFSSAMPTYDMPREDLADLVAYLRVLGTDLDPGLGDTQIRVGTVVPVEGPSAEVGQAMRAVLAAYFDEINNQGGVYNRKIELRVAEVRNSPAAAVAGFQRLVKEEHVFALAGAFTANSESATESLVEKEEVPLVGPFTLFPRVGFPVNRQVFYLLSGLTEQSRAMINFAAKKFEGPQRVAVVYPDLDLFAPVIPALDDQCQKAGYKPLAGFKYTRGRLDAVAVAKDLKAIAADIVFLFSSGDETVSLMRETEKLMSPPKFFLPGSLVGSELFTAPPASLARVYISFPTLPADQTPEGVTEYRELAAKHKLPTHHLAAQINAFCAAKVLVEAMKHAGKELSREKLISALESLYDYDTGLMPRVTFGLNRRIGALGAYVVMIDPEKKQFVQASEWIPLN